MRDCNGHFFPGSARTLARQFGKAEEATCAPFQFALPTRAGTDCVGHAIRAVTDANPCARCCPSMALVLATMCTEAPCWQSCTRFPVCKGCLRPSVATVFSLAIHDPLQQAQREFRADENLFAFLDDVHFTSPIPNRTRTAYDSLGEKLHAHAGIQLHTGKTRVWNRASVCPEGMAELGPEVWNPEGMKTPVGSTRFVEEVVNKKAGRGSQQFLLFLICRQRGRSSCNVRVHAATTCLRTLPPSQSEEYAQAHDAGMLRVMDTLLPLSGNPQEVEVAHNTASLPMRLGAWV